MSKNVYLDSAAAREADEVGRKFMNSTDMVGDMSRAEHPTVCCVPNIPQ